MIIQHDNKIHQATADAAEMMRQVAVAAAISSLGGSAQAAAIKVAEIAFYRSVIASCVANSLPFANFQQALRDLGTGGA
jgi:hypothetical protein